MSTHVPLIYRGFASRLSLTPTQPTSAMAFSHWEPPAYSLFPRTFHQVDEEAEQNNNPIWAPWAEALLTRPSLDPLPSRPRRRRQHRAQVMLGIPARPLVHPAMLSLASRLATFNNQEWWHGYSVKMLAETGMFVSRTEQCQGFEGFDVCVCFCCRFPLAVVRSRTSRQTEEQHQRVVQAHSYHDCTYLRVLLPPSFLRRIRLQPEPLPPAQPATELDMSCLICSDATRCIANIPCGHVTSCAACAVSTPACALCRAHIKSYLKLNFV